MRLRRAPHIIHSQTFPAPFQDFLRSNPFISTPQNLAILATKQVFPVDGIGKIEICVMSIAAPMETSCGFLLVNFDSILLLQYPQGHWSYPKGHVEGDEDHHSTARRELMEETGISDVEVDSGWRQRTEYSFHHKGRRIDKQVFWYIASTNELDVTLSHEHTNYLWLNFDEAEAQLTFDQEKALLRDARTYLMANGALVG